MLNKMKMHGCEVSVLIASDALPVVSLFVVPHSQLSFSHALQSGASISKGGGAGVTSPLLAN